MTDWRFGLLLLFALLISLAQSRSDTIGKQPSECKYYAPLESAREYDDYEREYGIEPIIVPCSTAKDWNYQLRRLIRNSSFEWDVYPEMGHLWRMRKLHRAIANTTRGRKDLVARSLRDYFAAARCTAEESIDYEDFLPETTRPQYKTFFCTAAEFTNSTGPIRREGLDALEYLKRLEQISLIYEMAHSPQYGLITERIAQNFPYRDCKAYYHKVMYQEQVYGKRGKLLPPKKFVEFLTDMIIRDPGEHVPMFCIDLMAFSITETFYYMMHSTPRVRETWTHYYIRYDFQPTGGNFSRSYESNGKYFNPMHERVMKTKKKIADQEAKKKKERMALTSNLAN